MLEAQGLRQDLANCRAALEAKAAAPADADLAELQAARQELEQLSSVAEAAARREQELAARLEAAKEANAALEAARDRAIREATAQAATVAELAAALDKGARAPGGAP